MKAWSPWHRGILARKSGDWFERDENGLSASVLPTRGGGVYQIGVRNAADPDVRPVYVGRALGVQRRKGTTLRRRIYSQYAKNGSHLANPLRVYLESGHDVWFRWIFCDTVHECMSREAELAQGMPLNVGVVPTPLEPEDEEGTLVERIIRRIARLRV